MKLQTTADFPLQNLPLGIFSHGDDQKRPGVAIGDCILDLKALVSTGLVAGEALQAIEATLSGELNAFFELGRGARVALREVLHSLLIEGAQHRQVVEECLVKSADCVMHLPARIND